MALLLLTGILLYDTMSLKKCIHSCVKSISPERIIGYEKTTYYSVSSLYAAAVASVCILQL